MPFWGDFYYISEERARRCASCFPLQTAGARIKALVLHARRIPNWVYARPLLLLRCAPQLAACN